MSIGYLIDVSIALPHIKGPVFKPCRNGCPSVLSYRVFGSSSCSDPNKGWLNVDAFHVGSKAADAEDWIIYDAAKGALYYDKDGAGGSAQVQFAKIDKHLSLTHWDFQIV